MIVLLPVMVCSTVVYRCVDSELVQGRQLLCLWSGNFTGPSGTNISNTESPDSVLLQVSLCTKRLCTIVRLHVVRPSAKSEGVGLSVHAISFQDFQPM